MTTQEVKSFAFELGADLVGIAPVDRWSEAPIEHSPQGILPSAKTVIVLGIHIPDACVELGAEQDPRKPGPGEAELTASSDLQFIAFRLAKFIQEHGYDAISLSQSRFVSYRPRPGAPRGWMSDMSLYYAAVAAGLGEIGWHNICITPEFGPRQRFVAVITDAPLEPDPMYHGEPLCDKCMLCAKNCPMKAFEKEVSGLSSVKIGDREFSFPNRNLWRCAAGQNFQLDLFLPWPERIDDGVILEMAEKAAVEHPEWVYGWLMGMCFKYCVPRRQRAFDPGYCKSPRRKKPRTTEMNAEASTQMVGEILAVSRRLGASIVGAAPTEDFATAGVDPRRFLPDAESVLVIGVGYPENCALNSMFLATRTELWLARHIEKWGFSALICTDFPAESAAVVSGVASKTPDGAVVTARFGPRQVWRTIITSARLPRIGERAGISHSCSGSQSRGPGDRSRPSSPAVLTRRVKAALVGEGVELVGVAPVDRLEAMIPYLQKYADSIEGYFTVEEGKAQVRSTGVTRNQAMPFDPRVVETRLVPRKPGDYLPGAKSVIIVGMHLLEASVDWAGKGPGQKAGHYMASTHGEVFNQLSTALLMAARVLDDHGYRAAPSFDLFGLASRTSAGNPDLTACGLAAVAAGLGDLGWNGVALTPEFGPRQRFAVLVTNAVLEYDEVYSGPRLCRRCYKCVEACPMGAISRSDGFVVEIEGRKFEWGGHDRLRCDWAKRYGLVADEGPRYIGSHNNTPPPARITPEAVCDAIRNSDRLQRPPGYMTIVERCFTECPVRGEWRKESHS